MNQAKAILVPLRSRAASEEIAESSSATVERIGHATSTIEDKWFPDVSAYRRPVHSIRSIAMGLLFERQIFFQYEDGPPAQDLWRAFELSLLASGSPAHANLIPSDIQSVFRQHGFSDDSIAGG